MQESDLEQCVTEVCVIEPSWPKVRTTLNLINTTSHGWCYLTNMKGNDTANCITFVLKRCLQLSLPVNKLKRVSSFTFRIKSLECKVTEVRYVAKNSSIFIHLFELIMVFLFLLVSCPTCLIALFFYFLSNHKQPITMWEIDWTGKHCNVTLTFSLPHCSSRQF